MQVDNGQAGGTDTGGTAELSLREELTKNLAELKGEAGDGVTEAKAASTADTGTTTTTETAGTSAGESTAGETGKAGTTAATTEEAAAAASKGKAPQSWSAADRAHWDKIPAEAQAVIARREEESHKGITSLGQEAAFGKKVNEVMTPYIPMIRAEGGDPVLAVRDLLQTAYVLRTASPEQKVGLFRQLAGQFGVDLQAAAAEAPAVNPEMQALRQELAQVRGHVVNTQQQQHQQVQEQVDQYITTFADDPKNEFFSKVKPVVGHLLVSGQAASLEQAYEMACWANPDVRSTILGRQQADAEAKRAADAKAKVDAKRKAAGSISGSPGSNVNTSSTTANQNLSLRDELRANLRAAMSS